MTTSIKYQLFSLKDIVAKNIQTLNELVEQSERMEDLIGSLYDDGATAALKTIKSSIDESIKTLIEETFSLFEIFETLVDNLST